MNYSTYNYKIQQITPGTEYTWLFFPGGPGLGSEYLRQFCTSLVVPGAKLLADFPKDGTNKQGVLDFSYWKEGIVDLLKTLHKPILVTHSFSGMFALSVPEIEPYLSGLVLMNTTASNTFFDHVSAMQQKHHLPDLAPAAAEYHLNPSSETYRLFWNTYKYYCFTREEQELGEQMIPLFAFNSQSYYYAIEHFYQDYKSQWEPTIPTLTIACDRDYICPSRIFINHQGFKGEHILNKLISEAGHCPWLLHFTEVQHCFNEFVQSYLPTMA